MHIMRVSIKDASGRLAELVQRALDGERVILTEHDRDVVELVPIYDTESGAQPESATS